MKIEQGWRLTHWPSLLILICLVPGAGLFLLGSIGYLFSAFYQLVEGNGDPIGAMIAAMGTAFEGILILCASWLIFRKSTGGIKSDLGASLTIQDKYIFIALISAFPAFLIGSMISIRKNMLSGLLFQPGLTLLTIMVPIIIVAILAIRNIYLGPRWHLSAVFGLGMTLTPVIIILVEVIIAVIFIAILVLALASQPESFSGIFQVIQNIDSQPGQEKLLGFFASILAKPGIIAGIMLYLAVVVPLVEELIKPLGVWLFSKQINQPAQGFALGIVCGAAFAIIEGLGISSHGGPQWPVIVGLRAGTSLLHVATTGLMGYAIVSALKKKKISLLVGTYFTAASIHGLWNAAAVGMGISVVSGVAGFENGIQFVLAPSIGAIAVLATGLLIMLPPINRRLAV